jgi:hypothetical protein
VHDEFRVRVAVQKPRELVAALHALTPAELPGWEGARVAVTGEQDHVFIYADSLALAEQAQEAVRRAMSDSGLDGEISLWRWHPLEERWEDASLPLPQTDSELEAERTRRDETETAESLKAGHPEWEVRITLSTRHDAHLFAERLEAEGIPVIRRWRHLMVGANNEDEAAALAERLRSEAPKGSEIVSMGSGDEPVRIVQESEERFAFFGGLAW